MRNAWKWLVPLAFVLGVVVWLATPGSLGPPFAFLSGRTVVDEQVFPARQGYEYVTVYSFQADYEPFVAAVQRDLSKGGWSEDMGYLMSHFDRGSSDGSMPRHVSISRDERVLRERTSWDQGTPAKGWVTVRVVWTHRPDKSWFDRLKSFLGF